MEATLYLPHMDPRDLAGRMERRRDEFIGVLAEMVNVDSGSFSPGGVDRIADLCEKRFWAGGWQVERISHVPVDGEDQLGDLVIGRFPGDGPNILLIGHMDTVFDDGTADERPFRIDGDRAFGPGVSDMKSGLLAGFFAVEMLQEAGPALGNLTFICNPDEEIGSPFSGPVIRDLAQVADYALVLEGAREDGSIVSARKGVTDFEVQIVGRAAHAGVEPDRGRSAVLEAAHKTIALHSLNGQWPGVTVNVGVMAGGTRPNVVADHCRLHIDVRASHEETLELVEAELARICTTHVVPDVEVIVEERQWHRPMERTEASTRLVVIAKGIAAELGFELRDESTGGASDANTTSSAGVPTIDGLGLVGGDAHAESEWIDLESVVPRVALLAGIIARLSERKAA